MASKSKSLKQQRVAERKEAIDDLRKEVLRNLKDSAAFLRFVSVSAREMGVGLTKTEANKLLARWEKSFERWAKGLK